jgi:hypothetical protein
MKKYLINYAHLRYYESQKKNTASGMEVGGFDRAISYKIHDLDDAFRKRNHDILQQKRGAGYWLWKPYIVCKALGNTDLGDWLFYCDSGAHFLRSIDVLIRHCEERDGDLLLFHHGRTLTQQKWTKRDCFHYMGADFPEMLNLPQLNAAFLLCRKTDFTVHFFNQWLHHCQDARILTDAPNVCGLENYPGFVDHRHDQSVLSLLGYMYGALLLPNISQQGNNLRAKSIPQIIQHTRHSK